MSLKVNSGHKLPVTYTWRWAVVNLCFMLHGLPYSACGVELKVSSHLYLGEEMDFVVL